jgi:hypothetical protein
MQSVTSNAVAVAFSYPTSEIDTGLVWYNGNKIYKKYYVYKNVSLVNGTSVRVGQIDDINYEKIIDFKETIIGIVGGIRRVLSNRCYESFLSYPNYNVQQFFSTAVFVADIYCTILYTK